MIGMYENMNCQNESALQLLFTVPCFDGFNIALPSSLCWVNYTLTLTFLYWIQTYKYNFSYIIEQRCNLERIL